MDNIQINDVYVIDNDECIFIVGKTTHFLKFKIGFYKKSSPTENEIITLSGGTSKKKLFTDNDGAYIKYGNYKRYFRDGRFCYRLINHSYQFTYGSFH